MMKKIQDWIHFLDRIEIEQTTTARSVSVYVYALSVTIFMFAYFSSSFYVLIPQTNQIVDYSALYLAWDSFFILFVPMMVASNLYISFSDVGWYNRKISASSGLYVLSMIVWLVASNRTEPLNFIYLMSMSVPLVFGIILFISAWFDIGFVVDPRDNQVR